MATRGPRPSTAPASKQRKAFDNRPLGRMPLPVKLQRTVAAENPGAAVASLKSEAIMLQRRLDEMRQTDSSADMEALERKLVNFSTLDVGDNIELAKGSLLEILLGRVQETSIEVLQQCGADTTAASGPGRTSGFNALVDYALGIAERKSVWDQRVADGTHTSVSEAGVQHGNGGPLAFNTTDLAMNEPTATEVRRLVDEQRLLRAQLDGMIKAQRDQQQQLEEQRAAAAAANAAAAAAKEAAANGAAVPAAKVKGEKEKPNAELVAANSALEDARKESAAMKKRIVDLELEVRKFTESTRQNAEEERDAERKAQSAIAIGPMRQKLDDLGVDVHYFAPVADNEASVIFQRFSQWVVEAKESLQDGQPQKGGKKAKENLGAQEGILMTHLHFQNSVITELCQRVEEREARHEAALAKAEEETQRLQRVIATLDQRVHTLKASANKATMQHDSSIQSMADERDKYKRLIQEVQNEQPRRERIVNVKNQSATAAEREKNLRQELQERERCILDLSAQLQRQKTEVEREQAKIANVSRERQALLQRISDETLASKRFREELAEKTTENSQLKDNIVALRREIRDKQTLEAELQQKTWKLEVELHIAQNVVSELRQREEKLSKDAMLAEQCQINVRQELEEQRDYVAKLKSDMERQVTQANSDRVIAQEVLASERAKMIENEKEVERLKSLDIQMEALEYNFTNYAASKLAQREAGEEEERALHECVSEVQHDVFSLPAGNDTEDQLRLYLSELEEQKAVFDNEERLRRRNKATTVNFKDERSAKKQLTTVLRTRFNAIQIYAVQQRIRQIANERQNRHLTNESVDIKRRLDGANEDLARTRLQCDALLQRNTELELERKQLIQTRTTNELEIKNLKNNVQRLRVSGEEQEKILVEVGTKLQGFKMQENRSTEPLDTVVVNTET